MESHHSLSASDLAWDHIFKNPAWNQNSPSHLILKLRKLFDDDNSFDHMHYTVLHRIVLGLSGADLVQQLDLDNSQINKVDSHGRTPLHWAARRGDLDKTESLLKWGASPNIADHEGTTALHDAASDGTEECVVALLKAGADVNMRSVYGSSALHHVFFQQRAQEGIIDALIRYNADPNEKNNAGSSPLFYAIPISMEGQLQNIDALYKRGAGLDVRDPDGDTLVLRAVRKNDTKMLQFLAEKGAKFDVVGPHKRNVLHYAACNGRIETIRLLEKRRIKGIDVAAKDILGLTPAEAFEKRRPELFIGERAPIEQERAAFDALVASTQDAVLTTDTETPLKNLQDKAILVGSPHQIEIAVKEIPA
ncbi:MAG: hypothetical protein Q9214_006227 [Letrouitia sp. 1 TL-2023]